jgi:PAS domain S-box-containing protein
MEKRKPLIGKLPGGCQNLIFVTDGKEVLDANRRFYRFFGVNSSEEFRHRYRELSEVVEKVEAYGYLHPDGGEEWLAPLKREGEKRYRLRLRGEKGSRVFAVTLTTAREKGVVRYVLHLSDITDIEEYKLRIKATNQRLEEYMKVLDAADIVTRTNPEGIITYANDRFLEVSGYSREEIIGKNHRIVRHPEMPSSLFAEMWKTIRAGKVWQGRITNRRKDGSSYIVDATIGPIYGDDGEIEEFIGIRHDVTELVKAKERAERAEMTKTLFFANLSHEIRTPLNAILGFTSLLRHRNDLPEEVQKMVSVIDESGSTLLQIVNDILDLSKFEQGHLSIEKRPVSLERILRRTVALFEAKAREKEIRLRLEIDPGLDRRVYGDSHRLRQVLSNLISNGIKFTDSGGEIAVRAKLEKEEHGTLRVHFEVADTGIGIEPGAREKIFRPFEQADSSTERRFGGTGLGLPICARIVEALGGELSLDSEVGKGSRFHFTVDFEEAPDGELTACEEDKREENTGKDIRFFGEVLLAEDMPFNQELIRAFLKRYGVEKLEIVDNGKDALKRIREHHYDLVFLDIEMPGLRGDEVLKQLREEEEDLDTRQRIVALTAYADGESLRHFLELGFDDVVVKPVNNKALKQVLARYLRTQEYLDVPETESSGKGWNKEGGFHKEFLAGAEREIADLLKLAKVGEKEALVRRIQKFQAGASGVGLAEIAEIAGKLLQLLKSRQSDSRSPGILEELESLRDEVEKVGQ